MLDDSYLDPPEPEEGPECMECDDGFGEYDKDRGNARVYICDSCGAEILESMEPEPIQPDVQLTDKEDEVVWRMKCPHGNEWGECGTCDHLGDLAYDAARESRR